LKTATRMLAIAVLLALAVSASGCALPGKGTVHLTVDLKADQACWVQTEIKAPVVSDLILKLVKDDEPEAKEKDKEKEEGDAEAKEKALELKRTVRGADEYAAFLIRFSDVSVLQKLVSTGHTATNIVPWVADLAAASQGIQIPDQILSVVGGIPAPFSQFEVTVDDTAKLWTTYRLRAEVSEGTSQTMTRMADLTYHVIMPGAVTESNAELREGRELTWQLRRGQTLVIEAESRVSKLPGGSVLPWALGGAALLLAGIGGVVVYLTSRSRVKRRSTRPMPETDYGGPYEPFDGSLDSGYESAASTDYGSSYDPAGGPGAGSSWTDGGSTPDTGSYGDAGTSGDWESS